jgi:hypothetical protein
MNILLLALLGIAIVLAAIQSYRVDYHMKACDQCQHELGYAKAAVYALRKYGKGLEDELDNELNRNWARNQVLNEHPKLHTKQLRRILNAHYKRQYNHKMPLDNDRQLALYYQSMLRINNHRKDKRNSTTYLKLVKEQRLLMKHHIQA